MTQCFHPQWLDLSGIDFDWSLTYAHRLRTLAGLLSHPSQQFPSLVYFVGADSKTRNLRRLFSFSDHQARKGHGIGNIDVDLNTSCSDFPIYFADCEIHGLCSNNLGPWNGCHPDITRAMHVGAQSQKKVISLIQTSLVFPFLHLICVFAADWPSSEACTSYLVDWLHNLSSPHQPRLKALPHLLIVVPSAWKSTFPPISMSQHIRPLVLLARDHVRI